MSPVAPIRKQRYCATCGRSTPHARTTLGTGWGLLLTLLTAGLFVGPWLLLKVWELVDGKWRCQVCDPGRGA